jgi:hypothetical protein
MVVSNMAKRTEWDISPCSIVTTRHSDRLLTRWVQHDAEISVALEKLEETRAMASSLEAEANEGEQFQQQQLEQDLLQLQSIAASGGLENQVALLTKLLQSTVTRVQVLERQNSAQTAIIDQLTAQTKQLKLHSANLHRQVARAMCTETDDVACKQAYKFAVDILANVLGAEHTHTVAVSKESSGVYCADSVKALHDFAVAYITTVDMNASKQKLRGASPAQTKPFNSCCSSVHDDSFYINEFTLPAIGLRCAIWCSRVMLVRGAVQHPATAPSAIRRMSHGSCR